jgi:hypothetical protein
MADAAKVLTLNDQAYVSPYLMRPLRRLADVERSRRAAAADRTEGAEEKPARRQTPAASERAEETRRG